MVIDTSNPLDLSRGFPPSLFVSNTDSLAEQLQQALPQVRLVKMFNTMAHEVMVDPARARVRSRRSSSPATTPTPGSSPPTLAADLGWTDVLDLGDLTAARGLEMYIPLWLRLYGAVGRPGFNIKVVR